MVRAAERPVAGQGPALDQSRHRPDHGGLQQLLRGERRQQARQPRRHHRLARAGRPDKKQIVPPGRRDLQRPFGALLTLDLAQVGDAVARPHCAGFRPPKHLGALEMVDQSDQGARGQHRHLPGPGGLGAIGLGTDQAQPHGVHRHRRGQGPADRGDPSVQPQLPHRRPARQHVRRDHPHGGQQGQGDRQVEMTALLGQVGRGHVDDDPLGRKRQADPGKGPPHPLAALRHRLVGQADDGEGRLVARRQLMDLHIHPPGIHPLESHRHHAGEHVRLPLYEKNEPRTAAFGKRGD